MLAGVRCTWLEPGKTLQPSCSACRACALSGRNPCGLPVPIIFQATQDRDPKVVQQSATMFAGCPREHAIKKHHAWYIDPQRAYTRAIGSLFHKGAEMLVELKKEGDDLSQFETEKRYYRDFLLADGRTVTISAQLDVLIEEPDGSYIIQDYKVTDSLAPRTLARKVSHYISQFSIQRWILAGMGKTVSRVDLHFMIHKDHRRINLFPDGEESMPEACLMSLEETELYLDDLLPTLVDGLEGTKIPPVITDSADYWRCRYCDVADICQQLYGKQLPALT